MAWLIAAIIASAILTYAGISGGVSVHSTGVRRNNMRDYIREWAKNNGVSLTEEQIDHLIDEFGDQGGDNWFTQAWNWGTWGDQSDYAALDEWLNQQLAAQKEIGEQPDPITAEELEEISAEAQAEIDAEIASIEQLYADTNAEINALYDQVLNRQTNAFQTELDASNDAYNAYANQLLTNDIQQQNSMQGAYRYELERAQRNALSRGASAAMRLVSNINTNLGLQNQAAQQSLNTSNMLAQALLNQRQAASGIRQQYSGALDANAYNKANQLNNYTSQRAGLRHGLTERKFGYGTQKADWASYLRDKDIDNWNMKVDNYFNDDPVAAGTYRSNYGYGGRSRRNGI